VFYQADTIIVRNAIARLLRPEQFIIGCKDPDEPLPIPYQQYLALHDAPVLQMSYESAELAKCAINYVLAKQIDVANELDKIAFNIAGASYFDVEKALRGDQRIGRHAYLRPGRANEHLKRDVKTLRAKL
jgi:UDP-glucose 6-dehydrogenase